MGMIKVDRGNIWILDGVPRGGGKKIDAGRVPGPNVGFAPQVCVILL